VFKRSTKFLCWFYFSDYAECVDFCFPWQNVTSSADFGVSLCTLETDFIQDVFESFIGHL
jgi:hypothetical protein